MDKADDIVQVLKRIIRDIEEGTIEWVDGYEEVSFNGKFRIFDRLTIDRPTVKAHDYKIELKVSYEKKRQQC